MSYTDDAVELVTAYIAADLPVLPLNWPLEGACSCRRDCGRNIAKHPLCRHGVDDASTDPGQVAEWFARWPEANWGIAVPESLVVVDVDPRNHGASALAELVAEKGALPPTLTARTGGGGLHAWYSYRGPSRGKVCQGVDLKKAGGFVVAPPSRHASGGVYTWLNDLPPAYLPGWLKDIINPPRVSYIPRTDKVGAGIDGLVRYVASLPEGMRNDHLYWAACTALREGHDPTPLIDAAVGAGLSEREATTTVRSATRSAA